MPTNNNIRIGTLIHGTLRAEDLLEAFADELDRLTAGDDSPLRRPESVEARELLAIGADEWSDEQHLDAAYLINETLFYALNEYAPPHTYFGAHEGDGSDFGFWPIGEPFNETCEIRLRERGANGAVQFVDETCNIYVESNDHGNIAVFELVPGVIGRKIGKEIWSAV
jgi:hypothetical protein